jgi:transposase
MSKPQLARLFDVSLSSVKRYARLASQGTSLKPRRGGARPPKVDQKTTERLLEEDLQKRPTATVFERRRFLERLTGKSLSDSTIRRVLKRLGFSQKKRTVGALERDEWLRRAAWRVLVAHKTEPKRLVFVDEMATNTSLSPLRAWSHGVESGHGMRCLETLRQEHYATFEHERGGDGSLLGHNRSGRCSQVFEAYLERVLLPELRPGQRAW